MKPYFWDRNPLMSNLPSSLLTNRSFPMACFSCGCPSVTAFCACTGGQCSRRNKGPEQQTATRNRERMENRRQLILLCSLPGAGYSSLLLDFYTRVSGTHQRSEITVKVEPDRGGQGRGLLSILHRRPNRHAAAPLEGVHDWTRLPTVPIFTGC